MLTCVIVDDEPLARECISHYVDQVDFLKLTGTGCNPLELNRLLDTQKTDLVFLDIQMPVMNGIDFLKVAENPPMVIITTAYPGFALESYQLDVIDYLVKPITFARFFKAVTKAKDYHRLLIQSAVVGNSTTSARDDYFFIKCDYKYEKICFDDVLFIQGMQNYVTIHTRNGKYITLLYLKNVEENLDRQDFIRVHKSYVVSISKIEAIESNEILIESFRIPISRNYRQELIDRVVNKRLWKKGGDECTPT